MPGRQRGRSRNQRLAHTLASLLTSTFRAVQFGSGTLFATCLAGGVAAIGSRQLRPHTAASCLAFTAITCRLCSLQRFAMACIAAALATECWRVLLDAGAACSFYHVIAAKPALTVTGTPLRCHGLVAIRRRQYGHRPHCRHQHGHSRQPASAIPLSPSFIQGRDPCHWQSPATHAAGSIVLVLLLRLLPFVTPEVALPRRRQWRTGKTIRRKPVWPASTT